MRWSVLSGGAACSPPPAFCLRAPAPAAAPTESKVAMAPISFNEIAGWADDQQGEALAAFSRSCPKLDRRARHQDRHRRRREDHHRRPSGRRSATPRRRQGQRHARRAALLRGEFPATDRPGAGQVHRLFRARDARQPRAVAHLHRAGLSPAGRSQRQALLHARRDRAGRAQGQGAGDRLGAGSGRACSRSRCRAAAASISPKAACCSLGFDGSNNRPYTAIGSVLVDMGVMQKDDVNWPAIRDWLKRNPQQGRDVMRKNERYIFFKDTRAPAPAGSEGVPLTAQRSLAVDSRLHALRHADLDRHPAAGGAQAGRHRDSTAAC